MCAKRRELFWSLLLFLLLSGGISFAEQKNGLDRTALLNLSDKCHASNESEIGCLRLLRVLFDNGTKVQHLEWQGAKLLTHSGPMLDRGESLLENLLQENATKNQVSYQGFFSSALENAPQSKELLNAAFNAYLSSQDPHAHLANEPNEELFGIGAYLRRHNDHLYVIAVLPQSEAAKQGLRMGDEILAINGKAAEQIPNFTRQQFFKLATKWEENIQLTLKRDGKNLQLQTKAEHIFIQNVTASLIGDIGLLKVSSFARNDTCRSISEHLRRLQNSKIRGVVLDLRDNPGGLVHQAICVGGLFLGPNVVMANFDPIDNKQSQAFELRTTETKISSLPLLVIVNENTASAAEIVAAALQDQKRAKIVGTRTFGKGSMQSVVRAWNDSNISIYHSTHKILRPAGSSFQRTGVEPNYPVQETKHVSLREADLYDDMLAKHGPLKISRIRNAKDQDPCSQAALRESAHDEVTASAALIHCSL
jgi:carboxyl-terminal processing protease